MCVPLKCLTNVSFHVALWMYWRNRQHQAMVSRKQPFVEDNLIFPRYLLSVQKKKFDSVLLQQKINPRNIQKRFPYLSRKKI